MSTNKYEDNTDRNLSILDSVDEAGSMNCGGSGKWWTSGARLKPFWPVPLISSIPPEIEKRSQLEKTRDRVERIVRHDLKNPLNGVLGGAQLLMMDELTDEQKSVVAMMNEAGRQMLRMLDNSFDYLRMEDGSYQPKFRQFSVLDTLKMVETEVSEYAEESGTKCNRGVPGRGDGESEGRSLYRRRGFAE